MIINIFRFWLTLLTDALPLLEHPDKVRIAILQCVWYLLYLLYVMQIVFSREQTLEMMRCMQALEEMKLNVSWCLPLYGSSWYCLLYRKKMIGKN